ncbi:hypothetical protein ERJ75_000378200 [Trypanosoma vivax]|nr:hypothetical protein ERJ75_000378200 [Trypanosoma vivax]
MGEALGILRAALSEPLVRSAPWARPPKGQQDRERPCSGDASAGSLPARNGAPACSQPARENGGFGSHFQRGSRGCENKCVKGEAPQARLVPPLRGIRLRATSARSNAIARIAF